MKVTIKLDSMLANQVKESANNAKTSVEEYITDVLKNNIKTGNFEQRQFVGKTIASDKIDVKNHLLMIDGIYYRFDLINEKEPTDNTNYKIVGNNGNILYLKK